MTDRIPLQAPLIMTLSTATVALTASTHGAAPTRCALAGARTKDAGGVATTVSVRWMGARISSTVALDLIGSKLIPGTTSQRSVRKSKGPAKGLADPAAGEEGGEDSS